MAENTPRPAATADMPRHAVAVIGLAGRFPGAEDLHQFWQQVAQGTEVLQSLDDAELEAAGVGAEVRAHPAYVRRGTFLERCDEFDAGFFGIAPREAQVLDPQHRVFLECAWEALEHAGYAVGALPESVGVYAGAGMNSYLFTQVLRNPALAEAVGGYQLMLGNDKDFLCTRVSYKLGLRGPSLSIQTACSTSLVAVQVACRALQRGECDMALAGGVSIPFPQRSGYLYQEGMIFSPDGHCRPFDAQARGTRAGAGAGIVVLKRLEQALADGDTVHAVIRGIAVNNDGATKAGYTAPSIEGQAEVVAAAQAAAGVPARSIGYLEAHGTATPLGDPIEVAALTQAFRADTGDVGFCRLGSLKANLGHLDAAAGVAGLIKTVLALQHRCLPPLTHFRSANPALQLETSPFYASATAAPWDAVAGAPRRAGVSSFGIGGTNAHAVLEEAPPVPVPAARGAPQLLVWSARSEAALEAATLRLAAHLQLHPEQDLADVAHTLQQGRVAFAHRRSLVVRDAEQALAVLRQPLRSGLMGGRHEGGARPVVFLFSGQGSQHAGMGLGLYESEPVYRDAVDRCAEILRPLLDQDLRPTMFAASGDRALNETRFTQPALFVTEYALACLWRARGVVPQAMLGHSIGEYVAAHLAGVMSLPDALAVVGARGRLMQQQAPGSMAAVHLSAEAVLPWLAPGLEVAAHNGPGFCTVAGPGPAVQALLQRLGAAGVDARALHTSHAFHSAMMEPALAPFVEVLRRVRLNAPGVPYVSNLSGTWITPQQATSPEYYAQHLRQAVQFEAGLRTLAADGTAQWLEVGPGQALSALARLNLGPDAARRVVASMRRPTDARTDAEALLDATARLWLAGCPIDWSGLHTGPRRRVPLPTYPFERKRYAVEPVASAAPAAAPASGVARHSRVDDWFYAPTWSRDDAACANDAAAGQRWLVLGDAGALTSAVVAELRRRGLEALRADAAALTQALGPDHWQVDRESQPGLAQLLRETGAQPWQGVLNLWSLDGGALPPQDPQSTYHTLLALARALPADAARRRLLHAGTGAESVCDEPVRDATRALAGGPVLVLPTEMPGLQLRAVDLEANADGRVDPATAARALADEIGLDDGEPQVARRAGRRWVRRYERLALPAPAEAALPVRPQGCYLITGGLGGLGLTLARWLGTQFQARLVLTARRTLPERADWAQWLAGHDAADATSRAIRTVQEIEAAGGAVHWAGADAADAAAMAAALAAARQRFGALHGVFHAAGIAGRGSIVQRATAAEAQAVFAPKVGGLQVLQQLLGSTDLDLVVLMSSISAVIPGPGTCDYAAANAVFDAFVDSAERPAAWKQVVAIDWGAWREVGMAAGMQVPESLRAKWSAHLAGAIAPAAGLQALARVLASRRRRVVVDTYDVPQGHARLRQAGRAGAAEDRPDAGSGEAAPTAAPAGAAVAAAPGATTRPPLSTPFVEPDTVVQRRLAEIWQQLLGVQGIGVDDDFFELGGHSLMFTRVLALIDEAFGASLPMREVFEAPTIRKLAERLPQTTAAAAAPGAPPAAGDAEREVVEL